ncbi:MAG: AsmA-like C-terminal region-containing protein, partial [Pseudomonadota bacterium]
IRWKAKTDSVPVSFFQEVIPAAVPVDKTKGIISSVLEGQWSSVDDWDSAGVITLEGIVGTGRLSSISKDFKFTTTGRLSPAEYVIESMELNGAKRLASVTGRVVSPLSGSPSLDLKTRIFFEPHLLKAAGVSPPKDVTLKGTLPVDGHVTGTIKETSITLTADLSNLGASWGHYLEKPEKAKGRLSVKGKYRHGHAGTPKHPLFGGEARLEASNAAVGFIPGGHRLSNAALLLESKISVHGDRVDLTETSLSLSGHGDGRTVLKLQGECTGIPDSKMKTSGAAVFTLNAANLALFTPLPADAVLVGGAPLTLRFEGGSTRVAWTAHMPLKDLDLRLGEGFHKASGVNGAVKATGVWSQGDVTLTSGELSLGGAVVAAKGQVASRGRGFKDLELDLKQTDIKNLVAFFPAMKKEHVLSGPVKAEVTLTSSDKGIVPHGSASLLGVNYHQDKGPIKFRGINGIIKVRGDEAELPGVTATVSGMVEGSVTVKGQVKDLTVIERLNGKLSATMGKGRIRLGSMADAVNSLRMVAQVLDPKSQKVAGDMFAFDSLHCDVNIDKGTAATENFRLKGPDVAVGAMGRLNLPASRIDLVAGLHTVVVTPSTLGKIPVVRDVVKKNEGLIKGLGLDKELKKYGIDIQAGEGEKADQPKEARNPITVIARIRGPISAPEVQPILESALDRETLVRLKSLLQ